jgi:hypothetical protein
LSSAVAQHALGVASETGRTGAEARRHNGDDLPQPVEFGGQIVNVVAKQLGLLVSRCLLNCAELTVLVVALTLLKLGTKLLLPLRKHLREWR